MTRQNQVQTRRRGELGHTPLHSAPPFVATALSQLLRETSSWIASGFLQPPRVGRDAQSRAGPPLAPFRKPRSAFVFDKHRPTPPVSQCVLNGALRGGVAMASPKPNVDATGGYLGCIAVIGAQVDFFSVSSSLGLLQVMTQSALLAQHRLDSAVVGLPILLRHLPQRWWFLNSIFVVCNCEFFESWYALSAWG